jgi:hypothetical protein
MEMGVCFLPNQLNDWPKGQYFGCVNLVDLRFMKIYSVAIALLAASSLLSGCTGGADGEAVVLKQTSHGVELGNGRVRVVLNTDSPVVSQTYFARANDGWKEVAAALNGPGEQGGKVMPLYRKGLGAADQYRLMANEGFRSVKVVKQTGDTIELSLTGEINGNSIEQTVELDRGNDFFHIEVGLGLNKEPILEYLLSALIFELPGDPDYQFVPSVKRADDDLIGDRKFFAPAAIVEKDGFMLALVPDLDLINQHIVYAKGARPQKHPRIFAVPLDTNKISFPTGLDLNLHPGVTSQPLISYGLIDYWVEQHLYWRHDNGNQARVLSDKSLRYGFDLFLDSGVPKTRGYQRIATYLWERYGSRYFQLPKPQVMPFSGYAKLCYPATFSYEGYDVVKDPGTNWPETRQRQGHPELATWQQWVEKGVPMGGLRLSAPQWYQFLYNTAWWNNACDATGIYYWGKRSGDTSLTEKARRIINFTLSAPQRDGIFPSLYDINKKNWIPSLWTPPLQNYDPNKAASYFDWDHGVYQTASASVTAGYLLLYRKTCEDNPAILPYVRRYADFLIAHLQPNGCVPAWFSQNLEPLPSLKWNADGGVHIWVLSELYKATHEAKYLEAAKKIASAMIADVMPREKWYDFETFYSCAIKPETFFDPYTGQYPANTMSVYWAIDGFASLYEAEQDKTWLDAAEACADYSIFYQAVWAPHFIITAYPFGGFSSQNSDGEWLDQRSNRFAGALVRVGLLSGRQDLIERGVAAMRASFTLANTPQSVKNNVYPFPNFPVGLGPENIDHEGFPQMPLRSGPGWCETGGLSAAAQVMDQLEGAYIDLQHHIGVGVDGVTVVSDTLKDHAIHIEMRSLLAGLPVPFDQPFVIGLHVKGLADESYMLTLNDGPAKAFSGKELENLPVTVYPDGKIEVTR